MLDTDEQKADLREVSDSQHQLTDIQKGKLFNLLQKYKKLFQGKLGVWDGPLVNIKLKNDYNPYHTKPYRIPQVIIPVLKKEVERLVNIDVLAYNPNSEWAAPSFAKPKKNGMIRFISDFRQLNKMAKR